jgi:hypothetical protein
VGCAHRLLVVIASSQREGFGGIRDEVRVADHCGPFRCGTTGII